MAGKAVEDMTGLVSIGQLARATGVSSRTIRYYEELGILPEPRRSPGGTRKYPAEYRDYINTALALKDLGFRLAEIRPLIRLALGRSVSAAQREVAARLVDDRLDELARQVTMLRRLRESVRSADAAAAVPTVLGLRHPDAPHSGAPHPGAHHPGAHQPDGRPATPAVPHPRTEDPGPAHDHPGPAHDHGDLPGPTRVKFR